MIAAAQVARQEMRSFPWSSHNACRACPRRCLFDEWIGSFVTIEHIGSSAA
jgi:hypothetical protein